MMYNTLRELRECRPIMRRHYAHNGCIIIKARLTRPADDVQYLLSYRNCRKCAEMDARLRAPVGDYQDYVDYVTSAD